LKSEVDHQNQDETQLSRHHGMTVYAQFEARFLALFFWYLLALYHFASLSKFRVGCVKTIGICFFWQGEVAGK
jgi:hypothetical protein